MTMLAKMKEVIADRKSNDFNRELSAAIAELAMKYGLPYEVVLARAKDVIEKRAEEFEKTS